jgi:hypothetical protein
MGVGHRSFNSERFQPQNALKVGFNLSIMCPS